MAMQRALDRLKHGLHPTEELFLRKPSAISTAFALAVLQEDESDCE